jgi:5'-deoxynucleotidase YfbR-like HD superfamily hydrolase
MTVEITTAAEWLRLSHIKRWGIVLTAGTQSVAEHTWRTWVLVHLWGPCAGLTPEEQAQAERYVLLHDMAEIRTGDMPTTIKTPEAKAAMAAFERQVLPELAEIEDGLPGLVRAFVKFCDIAEAVLYLKVNGLGQHAADVTCLLERQLLSHRLQTGLPEALYDMFTDAYHAT